MSHQPTADQIMELRKATGLPVLKAKEYISSMPPSLIARIIEAHRRNLRLLGAESPAEQDGKRIKQQFQAAEARIEVRLADPIEHDPAVGPIVRHVRDEATATAQAEVGGRWARGLCHRIWLLTKKRLQDEYGIIWFTPAEMNPGSCFD